MSPCSDWSDALSAGQLAPVCCPTVTPGFHIRPGQTVFTIGSCFARNIESWLELAGFDVPTLSWHGPPTEYLGTRDNGILNRYTPASLATLVELAHATWQHGGEPPDALVERDLLPLSDGSGDVIDLQLAGYLPVSLGRAQQRRREWLRLHARMFDSDVVVLTLGLVEAWRDTVTGRIVERAPSARLRRAYPQRFESVFLDTEQCLALVDQAVSTILRHGRPTCRVLLTTSPVPLLRTFRDTHVVMANMRSKSILRATSGAIAERHPAVDYFPSYEMVVMTDASQAFTADRRHVRDGLVQEIVQHLLHTYTAPAEAPRVRPRLLMAKVLATVGDHEVSAPLRLPSPLLQQVRQAVAQPGGDAVTQAVLRGVLALADKQRQAAVGTLGAVARAPTRSVRLRQAVAAWLLGVGAPAVAADVVAPAAAVAPIHMTPSLQLAVAQVGAGRLGEALATLDRLISSTTTTRERLLAVEARAGRPTALLLRLYELRADTHARRGKIQPAIADLEAVLALAPDRKRTRAVLEQLRRRA